jgi:hypothetical protein
LPRTIPNQHNTTKAHTMQRIAIQHAQTIYAAAKPIIRIHGVGGKRWKRNVATGGRIGPWLQGDYSIVNEPAWKEKGACLYLVQGNDGTIRYVGISRNGVKHRWRISPAYDAETMVELPKRQLFHSQCWKHIETECAGQSGRTFEVRSIGAPSLIPLLAKMGAPLSGFLALGSDHEGIVAGVERWICNHSSDKLASWNVAMTGK